MAAHTPMGTALLVGGPWDGHSEPVQLDGEGRPPELLPRYRQETVFTEDTGFLPLRIPEAPYHRRGPHPSRPDTWIYEP